MISALSNSTNSTNSSSPVAAASAAARPAADEDAQGLLEAQRRGELAAAETEPDVVVTLSAQAGEQAAPVSNKPDLAYEAADTDKDGKISAYEQQSYDFRHPAAVKARQDSAAEIGRAASAELKAYEEVAQAGRHR